MDNNFLAGVIQLNLENKKRIKSSVLTFGLQSSAFCSVSQELVKNSCTFVNRIAGHTTLLRYATKIRIVQEGVN